jgi:hypothetical protein
MRMELEPVVLAVLVGITGCRSKEPAVDNGPIAGREERALLRSASALTLFAVDPGGDAAGETLHGYPIRKTVPIPTGEVARVAEAVASGLGRGPAANCFEPHHALRVTSGSQTFELVICFSCNEVEVYRDGAKERWVAIDYSAEEVLAKYVGPTPPEDGRW